MPGTVTEIHTLRVILVNRERAPLAAHFESLRTIGRWRLRAGVNGSGRRLRADTTQPL